MKTLLFLGLLFFMIVGLYSFKKPNTSEISDLKGIQFFEGTFQEALLKAKDLNKPIFLDVYAKWCGPCKLLKKTTFKDEEVGAYFNANFINIAIDGETKEGNELLRKYNIRAYPSLLIVDSNGEVKARATGYQKSRILINFGKRVIP
ncbi:thioredoxin family protein [Yeosuana sp. AK3]|nr:thioredoxin family protein [Flavobacteriia bacterium]NCP04881.1 thioredoxin family protein [Flavobacteriales bacterium]NCP51234.1 thioredoxin family protein [Flavobacteriales bacterium]NCP59104.1 thioredoxin family protein [Flavobacteriales bacterium]NCP90068.1 thioredoxin family protein [Flavobacteriales bacterium]